MDPIYNGEQLVENRGIECSCSLSSTVFMVYIDYVLRERILLQYEKKIPDSDINLNILIFAGDFFINERHGT